MALGKPLVESLIWGISLYKYVCCLIFNCRQVYKSSILGMEAVTTSTRTGLVFFVALMTVDLYDTNLPVELLRKKSEAEVLYADTCQKRLGLIRSFSRINSSGYQEVQCRSIAARVFATANGEIAEHCL